MPGLLRGWLDRCRSRYRDRRLEPRKPPSSRTLVRAGPLPESSTPRRHRPAPAAGGESRVQKLKDLADLKEQGVLTEEEFAAEKARILAS